MSRWRAYSVSFLTKNDSAYTMSSKQQGVEEQTAMNLKIIVPHPTSSKSSIRSIKLLRCNLWAEIKIITVETGETFKLPQHAIVSPSIPYPYPLPFIQISCFKHPPSPQPKKKQKEFPGP
ncbi:hypothetical protein E2542_SST23150 [Spatholobus suberectus]|nr:hypothetical protein E2542_SST23150 [Spatholobus suberectus]